MNNRFDESIAPNQTSEQPNSQPENLNSLDQSDKRSAPSSNQSDTFFPVTSSTSGESNLKTTEGILKAARLGKLIILVVLIEDKLILYITNN